MLVLVTGATGGLGLSVVQALIDAGHGVRATGRDRAAGERLKGMGADFVAADLTDTDALSALLNDTEGVIHCAALSSPWGPYERFHQINVAVTQALLAEAKRAGVGRFVFVSSPSVYARRADQIGLTERDPVATHPLNAYAATKAMAEQAVLEASGADLACVAIRPRAIVGPDDTVLLPRLLRVIERGRFPLLRGGQALIELTDSRDVAKALVTALERAPDIAGEVINISGGRAMTVRAMIETLSEALARPVRFVPVPYGLVDGVAVVFEALCAIWPGRPEPVVTRYGLAVLAFSQTFDLEKAQRLLNYAPQYDAFETALRVARAHG